MPTIQYLSRIEFDFGALRLLSNVLEDWGVERPLLVADRGVAQAGLVDRTRDVLTPRRPAGCYLETPSNPTEAAVLAALELYRESRCDGVIALGGGSVIDLSKAVGLLASHDGRLADYGVLAARPKPIGIIVPIIAVPTTAGTGAEVGRAASITLESGHKAACVSPELIPKAVICDPELTLPLPPFLTAATGMDALTHGIEAFVSTRVNPPAAAIALDCAMRAARWIVPAFEDGGDREARWQMMMAALEGGMTFQKGLGAVHAASHPLGAMGLHHGTLNAVLLPAVLRFNAEYATESYAKLQDAVGATAGIDLADWVDELNRRLGMPAGLAEMGVRENDVPALADSAARDHLSQTNPRPATAADYQSILTAAMGR